MPERRWPRHFHDRLTQPLPSVRDIVRILREGGFRSAEKANRKVAHAIPRAARPLPLPPVREDGLSITWVGHATTLVRMGGTSILTDPVFSERIPGRIRRLAPPGLPFEALPPIDAVVVSHNHYDHQDAPTLKRLPKDTALFVPGASRRWFTRRGFTNVVELDWGEAAEHAGVRFTFTPVHHWSRRGLWDTNRHLWGGWHLRKGARSVYFGGDTAYGGRFAETAKMVGPTEVAVLPIGAYAPRWFMQHVHMDPDEAVQAFKDLGAEAFVPMHWGTFTLTQEPVLEPLERLRAAWTREGLPREALWDLALGETRAA